MSEREKKNLILHWDELKAVTNINAWKAVSALSGQMVEGLLKQGLVDSGYKFPPPSAPPPSLARLIKDAREAALLPGYDESLAPESAILSARILRNWASHASLWYSHPTEMRATQALISSVALAEALYNTDVRKFESIDGKDAEWIDKHLDNVAPGTLLRVIDYDSSGELLRRLESRPDRFYRHIIQRGRLRAVLFLIKSVRRRNITADVLVRELLEGFSAIVKRSSYSSVKVIYEIIIEINGLKLQDTSRALSIFLPFDLSIFKQLLETQSPAAVARYVKQCLWAEPAVFSALSANQKEMQPAVNAFWKRFSDTKLNILNMVSILDTMPQLTIKQILRQAPNGYIKEWVNASEPRNSIGMIKALRKLGVPSEPEVSRVIDEFEVAFTASVGRAGAAELHEIPLRLKKQSKTDDSLTLRVLLNIIEVIRNGTDINQQDWQAIRRILWDCYAFFPATADAAVDTAVTLIQKSSHRMPEWCWYCLVGLVALGGRTVDETILKSRPRAKLNMYMQDKSVDRWQKFLAYNGYIVSHKSDLGEEFIILTDLLRPLVEQTRAEEGSSSERLANLLKERINVESKKTSRMSKSREERE